MTAATAEKQLPRLKQKYREEIAPALHKEFGYDNVMQIPGLVKIVVNMGVGGPRGIRVIDAAVRDLARSAARSRLSPRPASRSLEFKLREGAIGCHVT